MPTDSEATFELVKAAIAVHGEELASYPGVLKVQPGYAFEHGEMTGEPAVEVLVDRKTGLATLHARDVVPKRLGKVRVDVRQATIEEKLALFGRPAPEADADEALGTVVGLARGTGVVDPRSPIEQESAGAIEAERVDYEPPGFGMEAVDEDMEVICHASPDAGWSQLAGFLKGTAKHLSATIYEFEAKHVRNAILKACGHDGRLDFVMQFKNARNSWDNGDAAQDLKDGLGAQMDFAWAAVAQTRAVTEGWFPTAYHIKVIVKDHRHLWLSSGNWKDSNQPEEDPFDPPAGFSEAAFLREHNREWHVIADCAKLAKQFEAFVQFDLAAAKQVQSPGTQIETEPPDVLVPVVAEAEPEVEPQFFPPLKLKRHLRVVPLVSPDNFVEAVTELVAKAKRRLYIQNQYLKPTNSERWRRLNELVRDFSNRDDDFDFKLIIRDLNFQDSIRMMREFGFDLRNVRILKGTHTKGILVDDVGIVVGSHNWSGQGFMENRDASLIFDDKDVIQYYERLFRFDWSRSRKPRLNAPEAEPLLVRSGDPTPPGMRRLSLSTYLGE
jgi:hypothetical protein